MAEAVTIFEDLFRVMRRVYGAKHPHTERMLRNLAKARRKHTLLVNLRFAVGDRVKCQCGEWVPGRVVRLLYDGPEIENPGYGYGTVPVPGYGYRSRNRIYRTSNLNQHTHNLLLVPSRTLCAHQQRLH